LLIPDPQSKVESTNATESQPNPPFKPVKSDRLLETAVCASPRWFGGDTALVVATVVLLHNISCLQHWKRRRVVIGSFANNQLPAHSLRIDPTTGVMPFVVQRLHSTAVDDLSKSSVHRLRCALGRRLRR